MFGIPIARVPYMWSPDPTVSRQTGLLMPTLTFGSKIGAGLEVPYFFNLAPNYDVTLAPVVFSNQGLMLKGEWRHRTENGKYYVRGSGIYQANPDSFALEAARQRWRGSLETKGRFNINEKWATGWDATLLSDRTYISDYQLNRTGLTRITTTTTQGYLVGYGDQSYFDMRACISWACPRWIAKASCRLCTLFWIMLTPLLILFLTVNWAIASILLRSPALKPMRQNTRGLCV